LMMIYVHVPCLHAMATNDTIIEDVNIACISVLTCVFIHYDYNVLTGKHTQSLIRTCTVGGCWEGSLESDNPNYVLGP
jgi:hypothetical protein